MNACMQHAPRHSESGSGRVPLDTRTRSGTTLAGTVIDSRGTKRGHYWCGYVHHHPLMTPLSGRHHYSSERLFHGQSTVQRQARAVTPPRAFVELKSTPTLYRERCRLARLPHLSLRNTPTSVSLCVSAHCACSSLCAGKIFSRMLF